MAGGRRAAAAPWSTLAPHRVGRQRAEAAHAAGSKALPTEAWRLQERLGGPAWHGNIPTSQAPDAICTIPQPCHESSTPGQGRRRAPTSVGHCQPQLATAGRCPAPRIRSQRSGRAEPGAKGPRCGSYCHLPSVPATQATSPRVVRCLGRDQRVGLGRGLLAMLFAWTGLS